MNAYDYEFEGYVPEFSVKTIEAETKEEADDIFEKFVAREFPEMIDVKVVRIRDAY